MIRVSSSRHSDRLSTGPATSIESSSASSRVILGGVFDSMAMRSPKAARAEWSISFTRRPMTSSKSEVCSLPKLTDPAANKSVMRRKISARDAIFLCKIAASSSSISDWRDAITAGRSPRPRWRRSVASAGTLLCGIFDFGNAISAAEINFRRRTRRLEQEPLQRCNAGKAQQPILIRCFNAFRGRLDVEASRERQRRRNDGGTFRPLGEVLSERLVDLDLVEGEHQQLA